MKYSSNSLFFAASPIISSGMAFVTIPLLTWTMPATTIADFGFFQYTSSALLILCTFGLDQAFLRAIIKSKNTSILLKNCLLPVSVILFLTGIFLWVASETKFAESFFSSNTDLLISILWLNVFFLTIHRFGAQQTRMSKYGGLPYLLSELFLRLPLLILVIILTFNKDLNSSNWVFIATVIGTGMAASLLLIYNRTTWFQIGSKLTQEEEQSTSQLLKFGMPLAIAGVLYWAIANSGFYFTQWFHGHAGAAKLVVATSLANMVVIGQTMFSLLWLPSIYRKIDSDLNPIDIENTANKTCLGAAIVFMLITIMMHGAQYFFGAQYQDIAPYATAISVLPVMYCISEVTMIGLMIDRRASMVLCATLIGLMTIMLANLILTIPLGVVGATTSTAIAAFIFLCARTELSCKTWKKIRRKKIYFGASLITLSGITAPLVSSNWGPVTLIFLLPFIWAERKETKKLFLECVEIFINIKR